MDVFNLIISLPDKYLPSNSHYLQRLSLSVLPNDPWISGHQLKSLICFSHILIITKHGKPLYLSREHNEYGYDDHHHEGFTGPNIRSDVSITDSGESDGHKPEGLEQVVGFVASAL